MIDEFDLSQQRRAMFALQHERRRIAMPISDMELKSGVAMNSFYAWHGGLREPTLGCLVAVAQTLGFDIIMRRRKA
ncbi:hypothetical protein NL532_31950 [Mesorhizobium sp. C120A]|uniref:hypothetical protein n=1 Tax=unclassified Mesorhizobium TaxID=325217 RepID=UPI0003D00485|nr:MULTISPECIES: hypothetical protein [unclassified Mesorhizobium]ESZ63744.1 hypothetical protein X728_08930 [Mesorhizobium sp. L103C120A0]WJI45057.1 hypothetical protein NL532_31950 [Mesorhizobium sp. C120A]